jgi:branched-chain amino acid transport system ATP-binding protein
MQRLPREITILIIEHDMDVAFDLADRIVVLFQGRILTQGTKEEIRNNPEVAEIYLGTDHA